ncbi:cobyrinate a,c-diamide synthase [Nocardia ignorata]|uniref:Hydrogenobyrinate a,c-diamide synthase n=1 Tax=Nocardia ignorata TaxID=145285 RepID=A0A4R6PS66_NOCIG|nr:cobyrinate a,c-diamide synthase [Nocardia ignorata]TDP41675.1 hydrogenobyrinic acid a,c-diamide synthase (glutamine-hydrolysing) /cobyrinate a,c-diamide synthase [Nocardia ignorata]
MSAPAIVIAAPASGSGKTTLATGLIGALRRAGHQVAPFKVGPDYIDPGYHGLAAGRPGRNLDPVLVGEDRVVPLYRHGAHGCDIAVVEGVMGLFDGRIDEHRTEAVAEGSTAQVASLLGAPVVLVVDARGHSQSLAALLHGFATFDSSVRLGGVILNRVGSERHEQVLRSACDRVGVPVLGVLPRMAELEVPSRHLGLIPAVEHGTAATRAVDAMTTLVAAHVDLPAIVALAGGSVQGPAWDPLTELAAAADRAILPDREQPSGELGRSAAIARTPHDPAPATSSERSLLPTTTITDATAGHRRTRIGGPVIAMAGGAAFTFGYAEHRELLLAAGAQVVVFDPLTDELPEDTAGLVLPGGFPEEHAAQLSANVRLRSAIADGATHGLPIHAECAGLLYLTRSLDGHPMAGVVDADAEFGPRLTLGYRDAVALHDSVLWQAGSRVRGHEFHRTRLTRAGTANAAWGWRTTQSVSEGAVVGQVHASYLHTHPAGNPDAIRRFVDAATGFESR